MTIHFHSPVRCRIYWICSWSGHRGGLDTMETRGNFDLPEIDPSLVTVLTAVLPAM